MRFAAVVVAIVFFPGPVCAQSEQSKPVATGWERTVRVDAITDDSIRSFRTETRAGYTFTVYRVGEGRLWARFNIPDDIPDVLDSERLVVWRVDQDKPEDEAELARAQGLLQKFLDQCADVSCTIVDAHPKWVNFVLAGAVGQRGAAVVKAAEKNEIASGRTLLIRYFLFTGGYKDVRFSLKGFRSELDWVLELDSAAATPPG